MEIIKNIHIASAGLFLLDYVIKTILLLIGSSSLEKYKKVTQKTLKETIRLHPTSSHYFHNLHTGQEMYTGTQ